VKTAVLDGEVVATDAAGQPSFQVLQNRGKLPAGHQLVYYVFDRLFLDGHLRRLMRKALVSNVRLRRSAILLKTLFHGWKVICHDDNQGILNFNDLQLASHLQKSLYE